MSRRCWLARTLSACVAIGAAACAAHPPLAGQSDRHCITDFRPGVDYYPDKSTIIDATNFTLRYHDNYQVLTVKQPSPEGRPESYVLVQCGTPAPALTGNLAGAQRITVPVTSMYSASTTQLGMLAELDRTTMVTGVGNPADVVNPQLRQRIDSGSTVGYAVGRQLNSERIAAAHPDVLVTAGIDEPNYPTLRNAGVGVVADAEWLEATPLGRAEWIKVLAALTGAEKTATTVYRGVRDAYATVAKKAVGAVPVPVLPGTLYQGTWTVPAGGDYVGRLIEDAGGSYPWETDTSRGSLQLNFESVYAKAGHAPLWLVADDWKTTADALAADHRYGELVAVRNGQVWSATRAFGPGGGNDYWERGAARPDLVLGDLVAIMHPDLEPGHAFSFYRQVVRV
jgi:iron complex transport system substrate-binding protein